jgi:hypothetical protein
MKERLLCDEFPDHIGRYIYNSEYSYENREFEFITEFEHKCLEQFQVFKSIYDCLEIAEKDEVIKYWVIQADIDILDEIYFSPKNLKSFDLVEYNEAKESDYNYHELQNTDPYPTFYINYYIIKFKKLIIAFFLHEEKCRLDRLQFPNLTNRNFYAQDILQLPITTSVYEGIENQYNWTHNVTVCFFQLLRDSKLRLKSNYGNKDYCQMLCIEFNIPFADKIPKIFSREQMEEIHKVRSLIFPHIDEDIKNRLEKFIAEEGLD